MGVIKHRDVFSAKYTTAVIRDSNDRGYFVPLKKVIGDFFFVILNNNFYAFSLEGARIITYREFLVRTVKWVDYDTSHFYSMKKYMKELELCLLKNNLPKVNRVMLAAIRILGRKERFIENGEEITRSRYEILKERNTVKDKIEKANRAAIGEGRDVPALEFKPYEIKTLINDLAENQKDFPDEAMNVIQFLKSLPIEHVVTPLGRVADSLQDDLVTTKASFFGEVVPRLQRVDNEHKGITNKPVTGKLPYLKLGLVMIMIFGLSFAIYLGIENHWFDSITSMFPNPANFQGANNPFSAPAAKQAAKDCSDAALQKKYPEPIQMKIAVQEGRETCKLSPTMQSLVDSVELPKVQAQP